MHTGASTVRVAIQVWVMVSVAAMHGVSGRVRVRVRDRVWVRD